MRRSSAFLASVLGLLAATACGPSTRDDNAADNGTDSDTDDSTCVPNGDFETCGGGVDDDCDGDTDCDDPDCAEADLCQGNGSECGEFETPTASIILPDGEGCTDGTEHYGTNAQTGCESYNAPITFAAFNDGQTLESVSDLLGICAVMEHSYIADLQMELLSPDGETIVLNAFSGFSAATAYLGIPNDSDEGNPSPGTG